MGGYPLTELEKPDTGARTYRLVGADGMTYESPTKGTLGGNRADRIYGRFDCSAAGAAIRDGLYIEHRVFFADEPSARAAGYRPCGRCMRPEYDQWLADRASARERTAHERIGLGPQYSRDAPFTARMRRHQSWYRSSVLKAPFGVGPQSTSDTFYGNMLDTGAAGAGSTPWPRIVSPVVRESRSSGAGATCSPASRCASTSSARS
jgi:hypothetical protein